MCGILLVFVDQNTWKHSLTRPSSGSVITKPLPNHPPFYSGSQYSAFFPCDEKSLQTTVTLLKQKEGGESFSEIHTFHFGESSSMTEIRT
jgi:hypothetical protein